MADKPGYSFGLPKGEGFGLPKKPKPKPKVPKALTPEEVAEVIMQPMAAVAPLTPEEADQIAKVTQKALGGVSPPASGSFAKGDIVAISGVEFVVSEVTYKLDGDDTEVTLKLKGVMSAKPTPEESAAVVMEALQSGGWAVPPTVADAKAALWGKSGDQLINAAKMVTPINLTVLEYLAEVGIPELPGPSLKARWEAAQKKDTDIGKAEVMFEGLSPAEVSLVAKLLEPHTKLSAAQLIEGVSKLKWAKPEPAPTFSPFKEHAKSYLPKSKALTDGVSVMVEAEAFEAIQPVCPEGDGPLSEDELTATLRLIAYEEGGAGKVGKPASGSGWQAAVGWPLRWQKVPRLFRCQYGHVHKGFSKTFGGASCAAVGCSAQPHLTFPEDFEGPLEQAILSHPKVIAA